METTRITLIAATGVVLFFLANYLCRYLLGFSGVLASVLIALMIAAYMGFSVARLLKREPTAEERSRMLWIYGGFLAALFAAFGAWVYSVSGLDTLAIATLLSHYLPYPAFAHVFLSDRMIRLFLGQDDLS
ncbi:hypothetical protein LPB19_08450 [Marinobacter salinisoli]|uniref:Uncharacterized protein n=1 Tax=Marinobacter salinisoli TaxID=2769486 RepID=A0ABX7MYI5_9GAMM|nr:hypothetical protein [Marinobacter salinisoli]QSP96389.1 hypothetical protein LPB19_08450 [Marinobacter salinisoli]